MFAVQPSGDAHSRPAAKEAEENVAAIGDSKQEGNGVLREPRSRHFQFQLKHADETHEATEREGDGSEGDAITDIPQEVSEGTKEPEEKRASKGGNKNQHRRFEIEDSHNVGVEQAALAGCGKSVGSTRTGNPVMRL